VTGLDMASHGIRKRAAQRVSAACGNSRNHPALRPMVGSYHKRRGPADGLQERKLCYIRRFATSVIQSAQPVIELADGEIQLTHSIIELDSDVIKSANAVPVLPFPR